MNGSRSYAAPGALTAVPMAVNSSPPRERPPGQPHTHHPVPAELGTLSDHPVDGGMAHLVHGLHQGTKDS